MAADSSSSGARRSRGGGPGLPGPAWPGADVPLGDRRGRLGGMAAVCRRATGSTWPSRAGTTNRWSRRRSWSWPPAWPTSPRSVPGSSPASAGITVVNPLRDHHVGWAGVTEVDLADLLRVHCRAEPGPDQDHSLLGGALFPAPQARGAGQGAAAGSADGFRPSVVRSRRLRRRPHGRVRQRLGGRPGLDRRGRRRADRRGAHAVRDRGPGRNDLGRLDGRAGRGSRHAGRPRPPPP